MKENRLAQAKSAYLRSAKEQPIDWYEFGDEAFQKARELDRPLLLDIGAVWCHWCHVIDRESYENDEIAELINRNFIAVKVDRDERPDIDSRYQNVIATMTGQGGWPLTAFLTYDGRVIYGGTYFPPATMKKLLEQIKEVWQERKAEIMADNLDGTTREELQEELESEDGDRQTGEGVEIPAAVFTTLNSQIGRAFDETYGGIGNHPKFPHFSLLEYMIQQAVFAPNPTIDSQLRQTLTAMAKGGIVDQIGGGFHRYSVDRFWHVPHFEKMAYDNAEALRVYAQAFRLYRDPLYLKTAEGIIDFTREVLSDPKQGGFYASQDADINLWDDGDYFTWSVEEITEILKPEQLKLAVAHFGMSPNGNMHGRPGRSVLRIEKTAEELTQGPSAQPLDVVETQLQDIRQKLKSRRDNRPTPTIDDTLYLNWNGMVIGAFFEASDLLTRPDLAEFARKSLDRMRASHINADKTRLMHIDGVPGFLEDYAWFIHALLWGYQITGEENYLIEAQQWTETALTLFGDPQRGGFYDIEPPAEKALALLKFRQKKAEDNPSSSATGIMIRNLIQLHFITGEVRYEHQAKQALGYFLPDLERKGLYMGAMVVSAFQVLHPPLKLELVGRNEKLEAASRRIFAPGKIISFGTDGHESGEVRICEGYRCLQPVRSVDDLETRIQSFVSNEVAIL